MNLIDLFEKFPNEQSARQNMRGHDDLMQMTMLVKGMEGPRLTYRQLTQ